MLTRKSLAFFLVMYITGFSAAILADSNDCDNPYGPTTETTSVKIQIDRKWYYGTSLKVHLCRGAAIKPFVNESTLSFNAQNCRGNSYRVNAGNVKSFTQSSYDWVSTAKFAISGSFHDDGLGYGKQFRDKKYTPSFPLMIENKIVTYGAECASTNGASSIKVLRVNHSQNRAVVESLDLQKFNDTQYLSDSMSIVSGLPTTFNKGITNSTGRNYVGVKNQYNGAFGTIVFLLGSSLTQNAAKALLLQAGVSESDMMMLDGSSVAQYSSRDVSSNYWSHPLTSSRQMPQIFVVE